MKWFIQENAKKQCTSAKNDLTNYKKIQTTTQTERKDSNQRSTTGKPIDVKTRWCLWFQT
jgi:hypothetical protein